MKWILALLVSAIMFFAGYHHASRYVTEEVEDNKPTPAEENPGAETSES